jgi:hypothetical protein
MVELKDAALQKYFSWQEIIFHIEKYDVKLFEFKQ